MEVEYKKVLVCDNCKDVKDIKLGSWHYANEFNSCKFCDICGTCCSERELTKQEIKRYEEKHEALMKNGKIKRWWENEYDID